VSDGVDLQPNNEGEDGKEWVSQHTVYRVEEFDIDHPPELKSGDYLLGE